jgi:hypothetical protein
VFPHGLVPEFRRFANVRIVDMFRMLAGSVNINATSFRLWHRRRGSEIDRVNLLAASDTHWYALNLTSLSRVDVRAQ